MGTQIPRGESVWIYFIQLASAWFNFRSLHCCEDNEWFVLERAISKLVISLMELFLERIVIILKQKVGENFELEIRSPTFFQIIKNSLPIATMTFVTILEHFLRHPIRVQQIPVPDLPPSSADFTNFSWWIIFEKIISKILIFNFTLWNH